MRSGWRFRWVTFYQERRAETRRMGAAVKNNQTPKILFDSDFNPWQNRGIYIFNIHLWAKALCVGQLRTRGLRKPQQSRTRFSWVRHTNETPVSTMKQNSTCNDNMAGARNRQKLFMSRVRYTLISYGTAEIPKRMSFSEAWLEVLAQTLYVLLCFGTLWYVLYYGTFWSVIEQRTEETEHEQKRKMNALTCKDTHLLRWTKNVSYLWCFELECGAESYSHVSCLFASCKIMAKFDLRVMNCQIRLFLELYVWSSDVRSSGYGRQKAAILCWIIGTSHSRNPDSKNPHVPAPDSKTHPSLTVWITLLLIFASPKLKFIVTCLVAEVQLVFSEINQKQFHTLQQKYKRKPDNRRRLIQTDVSRQFSFYWAQKWIEATKVQTNIPGTNSAVRIVLSVLPPKLNWIKILIAEILISEGWPLSKMQV